MKKIIATLLIAFIICFSVHIILKLTTMKDGKLIFFDGNPFLFLMYVIGAVILTATIHYWSEYKGDN